LSGSENFRWRNFGGKVYIVRVYSWIMTEYICTRVPTSSTNLSFQGAQAV
jgi:hypothetical protein